MIRNRLLKLEKLVGDAAANCAACLHTPRCVFIRSPQARETFDRQMREREKQCTCGRPFHVKVITTDRAVAA